MKKNLWVIGSLAVLLAIGAWLSHNQQTQQDKVQAAKKPLPITVAVQPVVRQTLANQTDYIGQSTFWRETPVTATTQGIVRVLNVRLHGSVSAGQPLLRVDSDINEASLGVAESTLAKARLDLTRLETLQGENNATGNEVETARLQVRNAAFQLTSIQKQLSEAVVRAPIGGTITDKPIERGMYIAPGTPLLTITDVSSVKVTVNVPETELTGWPTGRVVPVRFEAYPGTTFTGTVHHIGLKGGEAGRFPVEIRVVNLLAQKPLRVGMTAHVSQPQAAPVSVLTIPRMALVSQADTTAVYVVQGKQVRFRPVQTGERYGAHVAIRQGLRAGESVVVSGSNGLRDGLRIDRINTIQP